VQEEPIMTRTRTSLRHDDVQTDSLTLLDLVFAVSEVAESDAEPVETVVCMLESGRVRLEGWFNETHIERLALRLAG
jgi:hypothetical protein